MTTWDILNTNKRVLMYIEDVEKLFCPFAENCKCVGAKCMAWAFLKPSDSMKGIYVPTRLKTEYGYCSKIVNIRDE